ncbi:MAG: glycosyltransferase family 39 protein, partial [Flavobacteriales bacterium]|nr:glycosyltransferase family 39 protein [Flavobacteriales bacterium]
MMLTKQQYAIISSLIILIAAGLRVYCLNFDFMHDELSALTRLSFADLGSLIKGGIEIDGHPAGVQVFLYYWTNIFGTSKVMVRLPFVLSSILSFFIIYRLGLLWNARNMALGLMAFMSTSQYFLTYGSIARPYATGLFLSLALLLLIYELNRKGSLLYGLLLTFVLAATMYNHYFSFLQAVLIMVFGFFKVLPQNRKIVVGSFLGACLLFVPHISVTLKQFSIGGLDWLDAPRLTFIWSFFKYLCHYNWILVFVVLCSFFLSWTIGEKWLLLLFVIPFCIIFSYSYFIKPIIQFSSLLFCAPFLLFGVFWSFERLNPKLLISMVFVLLGLGLYSLIYSRKHFQVIKKQAFASVYECSKKDGLVISNQNPELLEFYDFNHDEVLSTFQEKILPKDFENHILESNVTRIYAESTPLKFREILERNYGFGKTVEEGFTYDIVEYIKSNAAESGPLFSEALILEPVVLDSKEWPLNRTYELNEISKDRYEWLQFVVCLDSVSEEDEIIPVIEIEND